MVTHWRPWRRIGSNAVANIVAGAAVAIAQLAMAAIAARVFDATAFASWTVLLSLAALTPLFSANLSSIVTRCLVMHEQEVGQAPAILLAARQLARRLGLLALVCIALAVWAIRPWSAPLQQIAPHTLAWASVLLILAQLWQIGMQTTIGWHYAREHAWAVAAATTLIRLAALAGMAVAWAAGSTDAATVAGLVCAAAWAAVALVRQLGFAPTVDSTADPAAVRRHAAQIRQLAQGFAVWSLGSAAIQYGLPAVMSMLAAARYNAFFLAYTLNLVALGVLGSVATALMAPVARSVASGNRRPLGRAVFWGPVLTALALLLMLTVVQASSGLVAHRLAPGVASADDVRHYVYLLGFQAISRTQALVFSVLLSAAGTPKQVAWPIVLEILVVLGVAGPVGVLWGGDAFLIALAVAGLIAALFVSMLTLRVTGVPGREQATVLAKFIGVQVAAALAWAWCGWPG